MITMVQLLGGFWRKLLLMCQPIVSILSSLVIGGLPRMKMTAKLREICFQVHLYVNNEILLTALSTIDLLQLGEFISPTIMLSFLNNI